MAVDFLVSRTPVLIGCRNSELNRYCCFVGLSQRPCKAGFRGIDSVPARTAKWSEMGLHMPAGAAINSSLLNDGRCQFPHCRTRRFEPYL